MPIQFVLPPMLLLWPLLAALGIYAVLRWVIWAPGTGTSPATVTQHALWVGVIGWMASSLQGAMNAGVIPAPGVGGQTGNTLVTAEEIVTALAWPIIGCLGVHAIGQISYPGPRRLRRRATLSVRRIRDFLPRALAWTTLAVFVAAAGFTAWTATLPPHLPLQPATSENFSHSGRAGRINGADLAVWLAAALLVLAAGTFLVLWLISRRRQLESLDDAEENDLLRTIAMNRLLRTVATVAAGLAAIAGNFAMQHPPEIIQQSWFNYAGIFNMAVLLVMWRWGPPRLPSQDVNVGGRAVSGATGPTHPATKLTVSIGAGLAVVGWFPLIPGLFLFSWLTVPGSYGPAGIVALMAGLVLLSVAAGELLMQRNYCTSWAPRGWPRQAVSPALLTTAIFAVLTLVTVLIVTVYGESLLDEAPLWIPTAVVTPAVVLASVPAFLAVRLRTGLENAPPGLDAALRGITLHRIVRTLAAFFAAQAAILLISGNRAWAAALGPATGAVPYSWWPATLAGAILAAAAIVVAVIPVRRLLGPRPTPEPSHEGEAAR